MALQGKLALSSKDRKTEFRPGERISGQASWALSAAPESVKIHLLWYTEGRGTQDVEVLAAESAATPGANGQKEFSFTLPATPFSFSGKLISLLWAIEVLVNDGDLSERFNFTMSPNGKEITIGSAPE